MAGAVIITLGNGVSMGTQGFIPIIEYTRDQFGPQDRAYMEQIYRAYDHEGMSFITLDEVSKEGFQAFYHATVAAFEKCLEEEPLSCPVEVWQKLITKLEQDPRHET